MSQMHFEGLRVSVYSARGVCSRCKKVRECVVMQADDPHYQQPLCKEDCWPDLLAAIEADREIEPVPGPADGGSGNAVRST